MFSFDATFHGRSVQFKRLTLPQILSITASPHSMGNRGVSTDLTSSSTAFLAKRNF